MQQHDETSGIANRGSDPKEPQQLPLAQLVSQLSRDAGVLAKQEIALAKQEAADKLAQVKAQLVGLTVGGLLLHCGVLAFVACGILLLAAILPAWLAALIAAGSLSAAGGALVLRAKTQLAKVDFAPTQVTRSVKEDVQAMKEAAQ